MVREGTTHRAAAKKPSRKKTSSSIWETLHLQQILCEPVGTRMNLRKSEARAIIAEAFGRGRGKGEDGAAYVRRIRKESGALLVRPDA